MSWTVDEGDVPCESHDFIAFLAFGLVLLVAGKGLVTDGLFAILAFKYLGIGIAKPDGDVSDLFLLEANGASVRGEQTSFRKCL